MFEAQKLYLRSLTDNDPNKVYYFPRQMGKTYVHNLLKRIGKVATKS